jgi:hypothetical protein
MVQIDRWYTVALAMNASWFGVFVDGSLRNEYRGAMIASAFVSPENYAYQIGGDPQPK